MRAAATLCAPFSIDLNKLIKILSGQHENLAYEQKKSNIIRLTHFVRGFPYQTHLAKNDLPTIEKIQRARNA